MDKESDSERPQRRLIDEEAKAGFLAGLRAGMARDEAAREAGFSSQAFYGARKRDPVFKLGWIWAMELSAADERAAHKASTLAADFADFAAGAGTGIVPNNNRPLQLRRVRSVGFGAARKKIFLDHFALTADAFASAEAAGVHFSTVYRHRRSDPDFARDWDEALPHAFALLEAEAVRQRLEAQRKLRESPDPAGEMPKEFERVMQLLQRMDRRDGRIGTREVQHGRQKRWTFEEAIQALDRKLRALGLRHGIPDDGS